MAHQVVIMTGVATIVTDLRMLQDIPMDPLIMVALLAPLQHIDNKTAGLTGSQNVMHQSERAEVEVIIADQQYEGHHKGD